LTPPFLEKSISRKRFCRKSFFIFLLQKLYKYDTMRIENLREQTYAYYAGSENMLVKISTVLKANKETIYEKLQQISTLQFICRPMARFTPLNDDLIWKRGKTFNLSLSIMGISFGTHTIKVEDFRIEKIATSESNKYVPVWKHNISLEQLDDMRTKYTDIVEIHAGIKTPFIWLWANLFYLHRQKKWELLLTKQKRKKEVL
jgi:hypothetical protein